MLKKNNPGLCIFYDKLITDITLKLIEIEMNPEGKQENLGSLNEDFILGYYYQKNEFYQKKIGTQRYKKKMKILKKGE
jgi:hypothetical protein